jgi:hypothetical protein
MDNSALSNSTVNYSSVSAKDVQTWRKRVEEAKLDYLSP